jgi:hypothetical protein
MIVTLEPWELDWAYHVAERRNAANEGVRDAAHYDVHRMQDNLVAGQASCCCEMAAAKALNMYWAGAYWPRAEHSKHKAEPDLFPDVEVRRIRAKSNPLAVRQRDAERNRRMVLAYAEAPTFSEIVLLGWVRAADAWPYAQPAGWDKSQTTRLVAQDQLSPMGDFD